MYPLLCSPSDCWLWKTATSLQSTRLTFKQTSYLTFFSCAEHNFSLTFIVWDCTDKAHFPSFIDLPFCFPGHATKGVVRNVVAPRIGQILQIGARCIHKVVLGFQWGKCKVFQQSWNLKAFYVKWAFLSSLANFTFAHAAINAKRVTNDLDSWNNLCDVQI